MVAEVMLQQTQVPRVIPRWREFLERYPTPRQCAAAPLGDVLRTWHGLGYPRRARDLHGAAEVVVREHGGSLPRDLSALLALPGIGPYTARAVLAFAFEHDVAAVDTNIARVLARTAGRRLTPKAAQERADALVPHGDGWLWNQAIMDLGATVCRPLPKCAECPLAPTCAWNVAGRPEPDPAVGSAGVSGRQAPYDGSARQARGRVLQSLLSGPRSRSDFAKAIVESLIADGLVVADGDAVRLP